MGAGQVKDLVERKKVFNIHFRNINGGLMNFQEVRTPSSRPFPSLYIYIYLLYARYHCCMKQ